MEEYFVLKTYSNEVKQSYGKKINMLNTFFLYIQLALLLWRDVLESIMM